jgi:serine protease AprX
MKFAFLLTVVFVVLALGGVIDENVITNLGLKNGHTNIMINMIEQADFDENILDKMSWEARGEFVLNTLKRLQASTQGNMIEFLVNRGIQYQSFYVQNSIAAYGVSETVINELALRKDISRIYSNEIITQDIPEARPVVGLGKSVQPEWNLDWINATKLWALGFTGKGTVVGGADTGIQFQHPSLIDNYRGKTSSGFDHEYNWMDGVTNRTFPTCRSSCGCSLRAPCDDQGHGTHTVATAVGGVHRKVGVSPDSKWIGCRAFSDMGRHWMSSTFITCLQFFLAPTDLDGRNPKPALRPDATIHSCMIG